MSTVPPSPEASNNASPPEQVLPVVKAPFDTHTIPLSILAAMGAIVFLQWAQAVFIPVVLAILMSYALTPIVDWLRKHAKLHKALGAAVVLVALISLFGFGLKSLQSEALNILDIVPRAMQKLNHVLRASSNAPPGAVAKIQKAASEIERAANAAAVPPAGAVQARPSPDTPRFRIRDYIFMGTAGLAAGLGQFVVVIALIYFLLIAGDTFRRTLVRISEDTLSNKKITVQMLDEINRQIQRYLFVQMATSALIGVVSWILFASIGLNNAAMWGCIGAILHLIPYVGTAAFIALVSLVAYVQFDTLQPVVTMIGILVTANGLVGLLLVPWLTQKTGSLNAVTVFIALLAWGWLWGIWGLLLGVPIMMAFKAICDRIENLQSIGAFLGHPLPKSDDVGSAIPRHHPHTQTT